MESAEIKNLKTKLKLYEEVGTANHMILYNIQIAAGVMIRKVIEPKMFFKKGQETVELTTDEFTKIRVLLAQISIDNELEKLGDGTVGKYLSEKNEKLRIIAMLS